MTDRECADLIFLLRDCCRYDEEIASFLDRAAGLVRKHVAEAVKEREVEVEQLKGEIARLKEEIQPDDIEGVEYCCECGADYPRVELVRDGEVCCSRCREVM